MRQLRVTILMLTCFHVIIAQMNFGTGLPSGVEKWRYLSPGFQIGKTFGADYYWSLQMTIGGDWFDINKELTFPTYPGITIGIKRQTQQWDPYWDLQVVSMLGDSDQPGPVIGAGAGGYFRAQSKQQDRYFSRYKLFVGFGVLLGYRYEKHDLPQGQSNIDLGLVLPLPVFSGFEGF